MKSEKYAPIGIFDSGYGGLTIYDKIKSALPEYDYMYLGDNARTPYGPRSFDVVYRFTLEAVEYLFSRGCPLIILACNTASAKALRTIQQKDLDAFGKEKRVLGIIRPTVEIVDELSASKHIGIFATLGTVASESYEIEIAKIHPEISVVSQSCPMWVPLVENNELDSDGTDFFVKKYLSNLMQTDPLIDTIILGCTHYPLLEKRIESFLPEGVRLFSQGERIAESLRDYLRRHSDMAQRISRNANSVFLTTESEERFKQSASIFLSENIDVKRVEL